MSKKKIDKMKITVSIRLEASFNVHTHTHTQLYQSNVSRAIEDDDAVDAVVVGVTVNWNVALFSLTYVYVC